MRHWLAENQSVFAIVQRRLTYPDVFYGNSEVQSAKLPLAKDHLPQFRIQQQSIFAESIEGSEYREANFSSNFWS